MKIKLPQHVADRNPAFSKLLVSDIMRRQVVTLPLHENLDTAIRTLIKYKLDALLVLDGDGYPAGVITKTEIMGAYYAAMQPSTKLEDVMGFPVIHCSLGDSLESALITMQESVIHRVYVIDEKNRAIGTLAYPDIVGALYRYCCTCEFGLRNKNPEYDNLHTRYLIRDIMTKPVGTARVDDSMIEVIEKIDAFKIGALLIVDSTNSPAGVISKTDLAFAYRRDISLDSKASSIMHFPVQLCEENEPLETGIRQMVFSEINRIFAFSNSKENITGVLTLSDAARIRSGSCQACTSTRILVRR